MPVHLLKISTFQGGGEIDNVILKATMNEILNGESPDIGYLLKGHRATQHIKKNMITKYIT